MAPQFLALMVGLASAAADGSPNQPTGKWRVDYGDTQCVAMRSYGERTIALRSAPDGESYEFLLLEPGMTGRYATQSNGSLAFSAEPIRSTVLIYSDPKSKTKIFKFRLTAAEMEQGRTATRVQFRARRSDLPPPIQTRIVPGSSGGSADLALTQMPAVLDQMDKCTADLRKHWNDMSQPSIIAKGSQGDLAALFSSNDYPSEAFQRDQGGTTRVILLIDEKGKVAGCYNAEPSGIASVDAMSCQVILDRGRFRPALDAQGKPVKSMFHSPRITFQIAR